MTNLIRIDHHPATDPELGSPRPERVIEGAPNSQSWDMEATPDGKVTCGVWEVAPGAWNVVKDAWELMTIISGRSELTEDGGETIELVPGVSVVMRAGFRGVWRVIEPTRKVWTIYEA
ncbi:cupin domain-containing protein [Paracoccus sp. MBLB3053]|uniref:Cupin domain-containing protein n=1 Tax=Paracoccus aurantius TaxID=3073814 RepID=A0ABU2HYA0_9RHOB|nr:cupin domain-containing protein [Paracoccus sp. MBLB3053]MDS9470038.1 cupin domain-containing protein [Paracoccus sp. MBLB3053]